MNRSRKESYLNREITVQGQGEFPFDMLRYDQCFPANESESYKLRGREFRSIKLIQRAKAHNPGKERWAFF